MRRYVFPEANAIAVKHIFHRPSKVAGDLRHIFFRNVGHVGFAATAGLQADKRDENIIVGKLDLGEKLFLRVNDSRNFHESPALLTLKRPFVRKRTSGAYIFRSMIQIIAGIFLYRSMDFLFYFSFHLTVIYNACVYYSTVPLSPIGGSQVLRGDIVIFGYYVSILQVITFRKS
jgi:hypothetical protein